MSVNLWIAIIGFAGTILGVIITIIVQSIIAKKDRASQFRLAALEKRLEIHQEAYSLWREMFFNLHNESIHDIAYKSQEWWYKNCLYLDPKTREAFKKVTLEVSDFYQLNKENKELKRKSFNNIERLGVLIEQGVDLPPVGEEAIKDI
ncbi:hypothetical protein [Halanaerobium congolense]|jgi:hypothetical protein|uniref:Uncharacterized protein n=1 Tax=Halanaerobium congolense TaxID=54121 RepID=A0A1G6SXN4_9FIRM|nr:hypothetical protein [Halanaerobium congolense]SDD21533.1 hypothetical protein SAMN04488597_13410 [Halanaerobium congolense]